MYVVFLQLGTWSEYSGLQIEDSLKGDLRDPSVVTVATLEVRLPLGMVIFDMTVGRLHPTNACDVLVVFIYYDAILNIY